MSDTERSGDVIKGVIRGNTGQAAIGKDITQSRTDGAPQGEVTAADRAQLAQLFTDLKAQIAAAAPSDKRDAALERVGELEEAATAESPDLSTMEYVKNWFGKHLPALAGAVTSVVIHPVVGKIEEAVGDTVASEYRRRFGGDTKGT